MNCRCDLRAEFCLSTPWWRMPGEEQHHATKRGRPIQAMDALLSATAETYQMRLVTGNVSDFSFTQGSLQSMDLGKPLSRTRPGRDTSRLRDVFRVFQEIHFCQKGGKRSLVPQHSTSSLQYTGPSSLV
jgi:hypothetical protein